MFNHPPRYIYQKSRPNEAPTYHTYTEDVFEIPRYKLSRPIPEKSLLRSANMYFDKWVGEYQDSLTGECFIFYYDGTHIRKRSPL